MFRYTRPMRGIFSSSRLPMRLEAKKQAGGAINVQKVRFRGPRINLKTVATYAITFYICTDIYSRVVFDPLEKAAAETLDSLPAAEVEELDEPVFIPFPGTTKTVPPQMYKGSDPEWKYFVTFSKDKDLQNKVRDDLALYVQRVAETHPGIRMKCGKTFTKRRCWLDIDFPPHPAPTFERSGIAITDDTISWVTQPVESHTVSRLQNVLWPSATAISLWNFTKVLIADDTRRIAGKLGLRSSSPPTIEQLFAKQQQMIKGSLPSKEGPGPADGEAAKPSKSMIQISASSKTTLTEKNVEKETEEGPGAGTRVAMALRQHFHRAIMTGKKKFWETWRPATSLPPRGSITVGGMVELESPKAYLVFDVRAAWDPATKDFDPHSIMLGLRRFQYKAQSPAGR